MIDIPVGPTAKVRSQETAEHLAYHLSEVAASFGLVLRCLFTDGSQPVGRGIGPALEARDVLAVLRNEADAPQDLCDRVALVAGAVLELGGVAKEGTDFGWLTRRSAVAAPGKNFRESARLRGFREPPQALYVEPLLATTSGRAVHIDNRKLSRLAKLAGAPESPAAGIQLQVRLGDEVTRGQSLMFCMRKPLERWPMHSHTCMTLVTS